MGAEVRLLYILTPLYLWICFATCKTFPYHYHVSEVALPRKHQEPKKYEYRIDYVGNKDKEFATPLFQIVESETGFKFVCYYVETEDKKIYDIYPTNDHNLLLLDRGRKCGEVKHVLTGESAAGDELKDYRPRKARRTALGEGKKKDLREQLLKTGEKTEGPEKEITSKEQDPMQTARGIIEDSVIKLTGMQTAKVEWLEQGGQKGKKQPINTSVIISTRQEMTAYQVVDRAIREPCFLKFHSSQLVELYKKRAALHAILAVYELEPKFPFVPKVEGEQEQAPAPKSFEYGVVLKFYAEKKDDRAEAVAKRDERLAKRLENPLEQNRLEQYQSHRDRMEQYKLRQYKLEKSKTHPGFIHDTEKGPILPPEHVIPAV